MKRLLIVLFCLPLFAAAQDKPLIAEGTSPNLYLNHTVAPKENYYSIGRIYNISPKEFAPYNNLSLDKGLALGQIIKIPLTASNFLQSGTPAVGEVLVPVYHTVKDKEGLFRISADYNKLPVGTLKKWNNISGESVDNGTNLIIGYLKVKKDLSPLAAKAVTVPGSDDATNIPTTESVKPDEIAPSLPKPVKKDVVNVAEPVKKEIEVKPAIVKETPASTEVAETNTKAPAEGFFKNEYSKEIDGKEVTKETGAAGVFKSTSGWEDGKFYSLHNTAPSGTIVKITNNVNGKSVYAKVLDIIPDIKQNSGLIVRISNAAAEQLGVTDESQFDCTVEYSK